MKGKKQHEPTQVQNFLSTAGAPPGTFPVIDPFSKKIFIPVEAMQDTRAVHRKGVPSLCRIFLDGRCRQGVNCFQAHADIPTVLQLRQLALDEPSCCQFHGARSNSTNIHPNTWVVVKTDDGSVAGRLPLQHTQVTNGLRTLLVAQNVPNGPIMPELTVPMASLCRLHGQGPCCRFGDECNFVHICREALQTVSARATASPPAMAASPSVVVGPELAVAEPHKQEADSSVAPMRLSCSPRCTSVVVPLSVSADAVGTPSIRFDPMALAATAPANPEAASFPMGVSPVLSRSFCSTPSGALVWRHNPYGGSSRASSVIET